jgi:hypothetical protein
MEPCLELRSFGPIQHLNDRSAVRSTGLVTGAPQRFAFRGEQLRIVNPERWRIYSVVVGNCEQLTREECDDGIPAEFLTRGSRMFQTCQTAMTFSMIVAYVGHEPAGEVFECDVWGTCAHGLSPINDASLTNPHPHGHARVGTWTTDEGN